MRSLELARKRFRGSKNSTSGYRGECRGILGKNIDSYIFIFKELLIDSTSKKIQILFINLRYICIYDIYLYSSS